MWQHKHGMASKNLYLCITPCSVSLCPCMPQVFVPHFALPAGWVGFGRGGLPHFYAFWFSLEKNICFQELAHPHPHPHALPPTQFWRNTCPPPWEILGDSTGALPPWNNTPLPRFCPGCTPTPLHTHHHLFLLLHVWSQTSMSLLQTCFLPLHGTLSLSLRR